MIVLEMFVSPFPGANVGTELKKRSGPNLLRTCCRIRNSACFRSDFRSRLVHWEPILHPLPFWFKPAIFSPQLVDLCWSKSFFFKLLVHTCVSYHIPEDICCIRIVLQQLELELGTQWRNVFLFFCVILVGSFFFFKISPFIPDFFLPKTIDRFSCEPQSCLIT